MLFRFIVFLSLKKVLFLVELLTYISAIYLRKLRVKDVLRLLFEVFVLLSSVLSMLFQAYYQFVHTNNVI